MQLGWQPGAMGAGAGARLLRGLALPAVHMRGTCTVVFDLPAQKYKLQIGRGLLQQQDHPRGVREHVAARWNAADNCRTSSGPWTPNQGPAREKNALLTAAKGGASTSHVPPPAVSCPCRHWRHLRRRGKQALAPGPWQPPPWQRAAEYPPVSGVASCSAEAAVCSSRTGPRQRAAAPASRGHGGDPWHG